MKFAKKLLASALCAVLALSLALGGCASHSLNTTGDLMDGIRQNKPTLTVDLNGPDAQAVTGFGLELLRRSMASQPGEGVLVSPLSVLTALAMTGSGAAGDTLAQMEEAFGLPIDQLREYLAAYTGSLPSGDKYQFHAANSLWVRAGAVDVKKEFLQLNADYFGAGVFQEPFDSSTLDKINGWVKENTHEMIPTIIDEIPSEAVLYLINALAFEAEWAKTYEENDVSPDRAFTCEDGHKRIVSMMNSWERTYLEDEHATGFMKYYADHKYAFAALLPKEGMSLSDYVDGLTAESLRSVLTQSIDADVSASIPKFQQEYAASLKDLFINMGMTDAFDWGTSNFSAMGSADSGYPLYIGDVLHKTYISVFEQGTKAGAATAVVMEAGSAMMEPPKKVILDRPFLYMIVDTETCLPIFIGAAYAPG